MGANDLQRLGAACGGRHDGQPRTTEDVDGRQRFDFFKTVGQEYGDFLVHAVESPFCL